jgi:hypothetical protein
MKPTRHPESITVTLHPDVARAIASATITQLGMTHETARQIIALKRHLRRILRANEAAEARTYEERHAFDEHVEGDKS